MERRRCRWYCCVQVRSGIRRFGFKWSVSSFFFLFVGTTPRNKSSKGNKTITALCWLNLLKLQACVATSQFSVLSRWLGNVVHFSLCNRSGTYQVLQRKRTNHLCFKVVGCRKSFKALLGAGQEIWDWISWFAFTFSIFWKFHSSLHILSWPIWIYLFPLSWVGVDIV